MAIITLERTLHKGINYSTVQWATARGIRSFFSNFIHTTPMGTGVSILTDGKNKQFLSSFQTYGHWYSRFATGCHQRLGDVTTQDQALSLDVLLALQDLRDSYGSAA